MCSKVRKSCEGVDRVYRELLEAGNPSPIYEQIVFVIVGTAYSSMFAQAEIIEINPTNSMENTEKDLEKFLKIRKEFWS